MNSPSKIVLPVFDPVQQPFQIDPDLPPVPATLLTPEGIARRLRQPPIWTPEVTDENRFHGMDVAGFRPAAVLVPIVPREDGLRVILTQRTDHLHDHAGQISFPGGRAEERDRGIVDTALRETEEETGISRRQIEVLGTLPEYLTISRYRVTPVVGLVRPPIQLAFDAFEVAEVFEVPLAFLMDPGNHRLHTANLDERLRRYYSMPYGRYFIWGATAGMLRNLYHLLRVPEPPPGQP